ncbi:MAG TPA: molybdopterin-dependent oxidoreductase [Candidatus Sulfotelmatobacter sp.]|nr:molybdopterin-dependent oxidoreductase [Candidatus Sulfotelmatobacter sp.]
MTDFKRDGSHLAYCPPVEKWDDWVELDPESWPKRVEKHYQLVPTVCFNCESACGLLAYVNRASGKIEKFEGNPRHPASRGRLCAKGPATINQIHDPDRILYPMKRSGPRGAGKWTRTSWDEVLETFGGRIRQAIQAGRGNEVMYHVGRPGHDFIMDRTLQAWGIDGHNSHTNVCSSSARLGYLLWHYADRPSPDPANARFILLLSAHLESGHYFNPHAQRIIEGKMAGAKLAVMDPRLSNTASMADYWLPSYPGTEAAVLLAMAKVILDENRFDAAFVKDWTNWEELEIDGFHAKGRSFESAMEALKKHYARFTPQFAASESGVKSEVIVQIAREIAAAGSRFASHLWRGSASGNLGGWQSARALTLLHALTGSIGTEGGHNLNSWNKFVPRPFRVPPPQKHWNELLYPREWPLSTHEMSFLLPHFLKEGRGHVEAYFTRVFNPVWTYPDGFSWIEMLRDEGKIGLHAALTPTWNETAVFADYVLPMGFSSERHDLMSQESYAGQWIGFRQPVNRVLRERAGQKFEYTYQANPGEVWEEDEFWINLSWAIDPDGSMGIRQYFESPDRPGEKLTVDEYYGWMFEHSVPGLPEAASKEGLTALQYMRKYGAFEVTRDVYKRNETPLTSLDLAGASVAPNGVIGKQGKSMGVMLGGKPVVGYNTPSRKLELFSRTIADWKWPEFALPEYYRSHIHKAAQSAAMGEAPEDFDPRYTPCVVWPRDARGEVYTLLPIFRLPNLIHTRSGNAKFLYEISHKNPLWMNPADANKIGGVRTGELVKVHTEIGYFVLHAWVTEGLAPGVVACSHHLGRWRLNEDDQIERMSSAFVDLKQVGNGQWKMRQVQPVSSYETSDPDTHRVWWGDAGVHQNLTFPVHPDPVSGMHCWHQLVRVEKALPEDRYGDIFVDTNLSFAVYERWKALARPGPGPDGLRRPLWMPRAVRPEDSAYYVKK